MAYDLLKSAKHIRGLSNAEFRVLFYLLESANGETHECYPSMKKIALFTDMSERTVQRHVSALAERGLFERVEQRRTDGSRAVNCYRFIAVGTIKIGRENVIQLGAEAGETDAEHGGDQPAISDGLQNNPPVLTPPPVNPDTTPRQDCRDIDQESEPGIGTYPPSPDGEGPPAENDLFGTDLAPHRLPLHRHVEERWHRLKAAHPGIADVRKIDDGLKHIIELRGSQHARTGEDGYAVWDEFFETVASSKFLTGRAPPGKDRDTPFKLSLPWAVKANNFREIIGGKYNGERNSSGYDADTGRRLGPTDQAVRGSIQRLRDAGARGAGGGNPGGYHPRTDG